MSDAHRTQAKPFPSLLLDLNSTGLAVTCLLLRLLQLSKAILLTLALSLQPDSENDEHRSQYMCDMAGNDGVYNKHYS